MESREVEGALCEIRLLIVKQYLNQQLAMMFGNSAYMDGLKKMNKKAKKLRKNGEFCGIMDLKNHRKRGIKRGR